MQRGRNSVRKDETRPRSLSNSKRKSCQLIGKGDIIHGLQKQYQNLKSDLDVLQLCRKNLDYESNRGLTFTKVVESVDEIARKKLTVILDTMIEKIEEECNKYVEQMNTVR